ncbi:similar to Saccharomyces cerevisiae YDR314C RAD34 Protein involved in nucleotide excision repair (NER) [Maudiozyma barnettii]|uniref:Similar to Saccharomyces cerevisiae YDR314C RAD34 Protein involved in nucleotide excision repair (NER) n=1 Tax=Maudiozyma barnettii TaxID=61262 RepID=A0A8H2VBA8_9SACH|nr:Rad34p [Kazachstania barnettii]CAB4252128.1 similar to Saccharomyces cerevisiae YDR314C RAD34 Protein involved in nucleotide excision repair (NER) [Kazachstania barnettii]CAD1778673.1 similar to Saccharomyces cerevisiae YDR314C RAD34 Protein involved in nucleotide excision repair (NER) [Kazachstania barnettii]
MKKHLNKRRLSTHEPEPEDTNKRGHLEDNQTLFINSNLEDDEIIEYLREPNSDYSSEDNYSEEDSVSEAEELSDDDWEDIALDNIIPINIPLQKYNISTERQKRERLAKKISDGKKRINYIRKLKFSLHLIMIPFMINVLRDRMKWCYDERLSKRLKRSVPKALSKKFKKWGELPNKEKDNNIRTLLLGLVMWFRDHYKINSNGFRQNNSRINALLEEINEKDTFKPSNDIEHILDNQEKYYGSRLSLTSKNFKENVPYYGIISHIRLMAKRKMAGRDILTLFFFIILQNIIPDNKKLFLCFALPLIDFEAAESTTNNKNNDLDIVPNRFDSDLLQPYFWIELCFDDTDMFVIDPVVHLNKGEIVAKYKVNDPISIFQPNDKYGLNIKQNFHYVLRMGYGSNRLDDVSPRYIKNLYYRYMKLPHDSIIKKSRNYISYKHFERWLDKYNLLTGEESKNDEECLVIHKKMTRKNISVPKSLKELKKSDNFIIKDMLQMRQTLISNNEPLNLSMTIGHRSVTKKELFWKNELVNLKSRQHWLILGRAIKPNEMPLKLKKQRKKSLKVLYTSTNEIKALFSWEQTIPSLKLKCFYIDSFNTKRRIRDVDFYRNKYKNVEIYMDYNKPDGFEFVNLSNILDVKALIREYNKSVKRDSAKTIIKYLDVVSGFDFKQKHGYAVPVINKILVNETDCRTVTGLIKNRSEVIGLQYWMSFLSKLQIKDKLDKSYGNV